MIVYFNDVTYEGTPLLWEMDTKNGRLFCLYKCHNHSNALNQKDVNQQLRSIEGIEIVQEKAVIKDFDVFKEKKVRHCYKILMSFGEESQTAPIHIQKGKLNIQSLLEQEQGATLTYLTLAKNNIQWAIQASKLGLLSPNLLSSLESIIQSKKLCLFRELQMQLFIKIYDEFLLPAVEKEFIAKGRSPKALLRYLKIAILKAMENDGINTSATAVDEQNLKTSTSNVEAYAEREATAAQMLKKFMFFINADIDAPDSALAEELYTLRSHIQVNDVETLEKLLLRMKKLIVCIGTICYEKNAKQIHPTSYQSDGVCDLTILNAHWDALFEPGTRIYYAMKQLDKADLEHIDIHDIPIETKYYALSEFIKNNSKKGNFSRSNAKLDSLTNDILHSIDVLNKKVTKQSQPELQKIWAMLAIEINKSTYISEDWAEELATLLRENKEISRHSILGRSKKPKDKVLILRFFEKKINQLLTEYIKNLKKVDEPEAHLFTAISNDRVQGRISFGSKS